MTNKILAEKSKAWLIEWETTNNEKFPMGKEYIAIMDSRTPTEEIDRFIEYYYASVYYSPSEMVNCFKPSGSNPYRAKGDPVNSAERSCGRNPRISARIVKNLKIIWDSQDKIEKIESDPFQNLPPNNTLID